MQVSKYNDCAVVDVGSQVWKVGWASEGAAQLEDAIFGIPSCPDQDYKTSVYPPLLIPSVVGYAKTTPSVFNFVPEVAVGEAAMSRRGVMRLNHPINMGMVDNWTDVEHIWRHVFDSLPTTSTAAGPCTDFPVLVTENHQTSLFSRQLTTDILFEKFQVPMVGYQNQAYLSYLASSYAQMVIAGDSSLLAKAGEAIVIDVGYERIDILPLVRHHYQINRIGTPMCVGGKQVAESLWYHLQQLPLNKDHCWTSSLRELVGGEVLHQHCYVHLNPYDCQDRIQEDVNAQHELPDGTLLYIPAKTCWQAAECLFNPHLIGRSMYGLHDTVYKCMQRHFNHDGDDDVVTKQACFQRVLLTGGGSLFPGFASRLQRELGLLLGRESCVQVSASPIRQYASWFGGCLFANQTCPGASLSGEQDMQDIRAASLRSLGVDLANPGQHWISRAEYEECGDRVLAEKCPLVVS